MYNIYPVARQCHSALYIKSEANNSTDESGRRKWQVSSKSESCWQQFRKCIIFVLSRPIPDFVLVPTTVRVPEPFAQCAESKHGRLMEAS